MSPEFLPSVEEDVDAFELLQEALGSGSWHMEFDQNGDLTSVTWSPVFRRMIGYRDESDFPNVLQAFFDVLHDEDRDRVIEHYWNAIKDYTNRSPYDIEYRLLTKNRGYRWFHAAGRVARREDGSPISIVGFFIDIDDKKRAAERLHIANQARIEQLRILQSVARMYFTMHLIDLKSHTIKKYFANEEIENLFKDRPRADPAEMMRYVMNTVVEPEHRQNAVMFTDLNTIAHRMRNRHSLSSEFIGLHTGWFIANFITIDADAQGYPTSLIFTTQVIDERKRQEEVLFLRSMTDEMTGFFNRRAYEEKLTYYRDHPLPDDLVFISCDINHLKYVNDNLGHEAGDELIKGLAYLVRELGEEFNRRAEAYRIGGDEFVILGCLPMAEVRRFKQEFSRRRKEWRGKLVDGISLSFGLAFRSRHPQASIDDLARTADRLMYRAKSRYYRQAGVDRRAGR